MLHGTSREELRESSSEKGQHLLPAHGSDMKTGVPGAILRHGAEGRPLWQEPGSQGTPWGSHSSGLLPPTYFYVKEK